MKTKRPSMTDGNIERLEEAARQSRAQELAAKQAANEYRRIAAVAAKEEEK